MMFDRYPELKTVLVTTRTDRTFRGVLWRRRRGYLVLRQAEMLRAKNEPVAMDGEVMVEAANVDFVQVVS
jgi:small nuclear ribonucleoprotein (snRNP)-like protein